MTRHEVYMMHLPKLKQIVSKFKQDSEDILSAFYIKWITSKSDNYLEKPLQYISRSLRNFYIDYNFKNGDLICVEHIDRYVTGHHPANDEMFFDKEVVSVYKSVAKEILPYDKYLVFSDVVDASLEDPDTTRITVAGKRGVSLNRVKYSMAENRKLLECSGYRSRLNMAGYV
jgi:hypothetical protein